MFNSFYKTAVGMQIDEVIVTAKYSLNGTIAETFPVNEDGDIRISFIKISLVLRLDKNEGYLQVDDTDFESSMFSASNGVSKRSSVNSAFDRILFWKILGAIRSKFGEEMYDCSRSVVQELSRQGNTNK